MTKDLTDYEHEVLSRISGWAEGRPEVRWCLLTSSRAGDRSRLDAFSDFDVVIGVEQDPQAFVGEGTWLTDAYGTPMVSLRSQSEIGDGHGVAQMLLVLYLDGTKVDFAVVPAALMARCAAEQSLPEALDLGWQVLVDKARVIDGLPAPSFRAHIPVPPSQDEFAAVVKEFWWESTYVAKNMWRGDVVQAKYNLDKVMVIDCLRKVLEWRIEIDHGWNLRPGQLGRHFRDRLRPEVHGRLMSCFTGGAIEDNWQALWRCGDLLRDMAASVADDLGLVYPDELDRQVSRYLRAVYARDDGADDGSRAARLLLVDIPAPAGAAVDELVARTHHILGPSVESIILHGSLTLEDFDPHRSDIDLLVIVSDSLEAQLHHSITDAVTSVAREHRLRVDFRVVTDAVARNPTATPPVELYVGVHSDDQARVEVMASTPEPDLVVEFSMCRQHGRALYGRPHADIIGHVPADWVLSVGDSYLARWQSIGDDPDHADLTVLTACRLWHYAIKERHVSKTRAAEWVAARAEGAPAQAAKQALARREGRSTAAIKPAHVMELLTRARTVIATR